MKRDRLGDLMGLCQGKYEEFWPFP